jgi:hypothetical protein
VLLIWVFFLSTAQALTSEQVLKTAWSDKTYRVHENILDTDSKNPFRSIDGFYSVEHNDKKETEVGLKFNLKSFPEWQSGRSRIEQSQVLKESSLSWALRDRYGAIVNMIMTEKKLQLIDEYIQTSERHLKAQSLSLKAVGANSKSYLEAKDDLMRLNRTRALLTEEKEILKNKLQRWMPEENNLNLENNVLIEVPDLVNALQSQSLPGQSLTGRLAKEELLQLDQELKILKGREDQWVKSFEVAQVNKKDEKFYELSLTLQLPPLGSDDWARQRQNELLLKSTLRQRDLDNNSDRLQILRFQILNSAELYKNTLSTSINVSRGRSADPMANIQGRILRYKEEMDFLNQKQVLLNLYLDYLVESEAFSKEPNVNHLSPDKKAIL